MDYNEEINIVVASDINYVPHLMTLVESIGDNNKLQFISIFLMVELKKLQREKLKILTINFAISPLHSIR